MQLLQTLTLIALLRSLTLGGALVLPPNILQHHAPAGIVRHQGHAAASAHPAAKKHHVIVAVATAEGGDREGPAASSSVAKERFLGNLERKRAGEDVHSSVLDADLSLLVGRHQSTDPRQPPSWRGAWQISYAPHIETLGKVILTKFGSVQYIFDSDDGFMVSHAGYENAVFGSGWFNADGRVVPVPAGDGMAGDGQQDVVKVGER